MFMKEENENRELNFFQNLLIFSAFCVILRDFQNTGIRHTGHPHYESRITPSRAVSCAQHDSLWAFGRTQ